jgi:hypothetical protein
MGFKMTMPIDRLTMKSLERPDTVGKMFDMGIPVAAVLRAEAEQTSQGAQVDIVAFKELPLGSSKTEKLADFYGDDNFSVFPLSSRRDLRSLRAGKHVVKTLLEPAPTDPTLLTGTVNISAR